MRVVEITTFENEDGSSVVIVRDPDLRELARVDALSSTHARNVATDCAMLIVRTKDTPVIVRDRFEPVQKAAAQ